MIFLVGFMTSGKSTIGSKLARKMQLDFCDLDRTFESHTHLTITDYFDKFGETGFRDKESDLLRDAVNECSKTIVATGGGVVVRPENRKLLQSQSVIYLNVPFNSVKKRLTNRASQGRPLAKNNSMKKIKALYEERQDWYEEVATITVDCEDLSKDEIVAVILNKLEDLCL